MDTMQKNINLLKDENQPELCLEAFLELVSYYPALSEDNKYEMIKNILKNDTNNRYVYRKLIEVISKDVDIPDDKKMYVYLNMLKKKSPTDVIKTAFENIIKIEEPKGQKYMIDAAIRMVAKNINSDFVVLGNALIEAALPGRSEPWIKKNASAARTIVNHPNANTEVRTRAANYFRETPEFKKLSSAYAKDKDTPLGHLISLETRFPGSILDNEEAVTENKISVQTFLKNSAINVLNRLNNGVFDVSLFPEIFNFEKKEIEVECFTSLLAASDKKNIDRDMSTMSKYFKGVIPRRITGNRTINILMEKARGRDSIQDEFLEIIPSALATDNETVDPPVSYLQI